MFDTRKLMDQLLGSGAAGGLAGGLAGGALAGVLANKKGRKLAGSALKLGGMAVVGGLAYKAWQSYRGGASAAPAEPVPVPPRGSGFMPDPGDEAADRALGMLLARAMIAAAKADGRIEADESQAIISRINALELDATDKAMLLEEYSSPLDVRAIARDVDTPEHAAEVYAASALLLEPPSPAERIYLDSLASELGLDAGLVRELDAAVASTREAP